MTYKEAVTAKANVENTLQRLAEQLFDHIDLALKPRVLICYTVEETTKCLKTEHETYLSAMGNNLVGQDITMVLFLNKRIHDQYSINEFRLIECFRTVFANESRTIIENIKDKAYLFYIATRSVDEILRTCAINFLEEIALSSKITKMSSCYNICNRVSQLHYENKEVSGGIVITKSDNINTNCDFTFKEPFLLSDIKKLRKIMELTNKEQYLISDSYWVYGLGKVKNTRKHPVFNISFEGKNKWKVSQNDRVLMVVHDGIPNVYKEKINKESFLQDLVRVNSELTAAQKENLYSIANAASELHHGGLIVISDNAEKEAQRLGNQSFPIESKKLESKLIKQFTSIDGAILMDWDCNCYAIGVILDGIADENIGKSTRGSRYNSAARYCNYRNSEGDKVIAIVVSEDGMVNIVPESTN